MKKEEYQEYEILFETEEKHENKCLALVEYDPSSNKPFMVYELDIEDSQYYSYSGEDDLETAIEVANSRIPYIRA